MAKKTNLPIAVEQIDGMIRTIRGVRVMLDRDLAKIYGVPTKAFNQAVKRNRQRFPEDFMFRLTQEEAKALQVSRSQSVTSSQRKDLLRSQFVTSKKSGRGGARYAPLCFTEQGIAMLSSVLNSERAVQVNIYIIRVFTRLRELLASHKELRDKVEEHDQQLQVVFEKIRKLLTPPKEPKKRRIGFGVE